MTPRIASFGRKLAIVVGAVAIMAAGAAVASSLSGEDSLLQQSWAKMQTASLYAKWKSQNKGEAAKLEAYWATGGTAPVLATAFGQSLVLEAQAYWSLKGTTTTGTTTTATTDTTTTTTTPPPPTGTANLWIDTNGGTCSRQATPGAYVDSAACPSLVAAYNAASSGDLVLMRAGSYGDQNTGPRSGLTSQITFKPEAGATVTIGSMWDWGASYTNLDGAQGVLHVNGGFRVGWGGNRSTTITNVTLQHFDTKSVSQIDNAANLLIRDVKIGNYCSTSNDDALRMNDPLGAGGDSGDPHDVVIEDSTIGNICWLGSSQHPDCFAVSAGYNVTIRRNRFYQCGSQGLYLISELGGNIHDVNIENNMFGDCRTQGGYSNCVNSLILDVRSPGLRNITVRYNSFAVGTQPMRVSGGTSSQNIQVYGNAGEGPGCENTGGVTYAYNVWDDAKCSTTDVTADPGFVSNAYGPGFDLHLASSASPAVGRGDPSRVPSDDFDRQTRPIGVVDAGADER